MKCGYVELSESSRSELFLRFVRTLKECLESVNYNRLGADKWVKLRNYSQFAQHCIAKNEWTSANIQYRPFVTQPFFCAKTSYPFVRICANSYKLRAYIHVQNSRKIPSRICAQTCTWIHTRKKNSCMNLCTDVTFLKKGYRGKSISIINIIDLLV